LTGEETEGRFALIESLLPPGEETPLHVHRTSSQTMYVLDGELTLYLPGQAVVAGPGEIAMDRWVFRMRRR
jgi:quercetin dioxygenase-like cupin family protein